MRVRAVRERLFGDIVWRADHIFVLQMFLQALDAVMVLAGAYMFYQGLCLVTNCESPVVVVLRLENLFSLQ
jgi:hypothetical protein